jgi:hypothetical protein
MAFKMNDLNSDGAQAAFGFRPTSSSFKPVHLAQSLFAQALARYQKGEALFEFLDSTAKTPSSDLDPSLQGLVNGTSTRSREIDDVRTGLRLVADNDNALYANPRMSAPTCTSELLVTGAPQAVGSARYLLEVIREYSPELQEDLRDLLSDRDDAISGLFRPLMRHMEEGTPSGKPWDGPELDDPFEEGKVSPIIGQGFSKLYTHLTEQDRMSMRAKLQQLRLLSKFASFSLVLYAGNRANEIEEEGTRRVPLLLNYTGDEEGPIDDASIRSERLIVSQVEQANRLGIRHELDRKGFKVYDEEDFLEELHVGSIISISRKSQQKEEEDYEVFEEILSSKTGDSFFERVSEAMGDAIHHSSSRYKTYTPRSTFQTFAWRVGLTKPRGNRANRRRFRPDPDILEAIILSVTEPGETISLRDLCRRLRERYGIIVGGTTEDREHLRAWDIRLGASPEKASPLNVTNYQGFKHTLVELGYAQEYADGVTVVDPGGT